MDFKSLQEYQNLIRKNIKQEQKLDRKIELLTIINQLTAGPKNIVQKEHLIIEATSRGFSEDEIESIIEQLITENIITQSEGYIKKR